jgi:hypothetical protein
MMRRLAILAMPLAGVPVAEACSAMIKPVQQVIHQSDTIIRARVVAFPRPGKALE